MFEIDQKGVFEKEIDSAVADSKVDFAVHSMKDVPSSLPDELVLACVPKREAANDVIVSKDGSDLDSLPTGMVVGTSSLRRAVQITKSRPDLTVRPIRGNVDTRIQRLGDQYDAVVLALAGINRLGLNADIKYSILPTSHFVPSPGQGALAIVARADDAETINLLKKIEDMPSRAETEAERAMSAYVESGCRFPVGAYAQMSKDTITIRADAFSVDGRQSVSVEQTGPADSPKDLGRAAGKALRDQGAEKLALNWRTAVAEWNKQ